MYQENSGQSFPLTDESVDILSEQLEDFQDRMGVVRKERIRMRYLFEETLLSLASHFGSDTRMRVSFENKLLRRPRVCIAVPGDRFNPLPDSEDDSDAWSWQLLSSLQQHPHYRYTQGTNTLVFRLSTPDTNPVLKIVLAIVIGIGLGLLGNALIVPAAQEVLTDVIIDPTYSMWIRLLGAISGPIILFTATTTTLDTDRIAKRGGSSVEIIVLYFLVMALYIVLTLVCCLTMSGLETTHVETDRELVRTILADVVGVIPNNLVDSFGTANTPQLLLIGFVVGNVLLRLGKQAYSLSQIVRQLNLMGLAVAEWTSRFVPFFVGAFLCLEIWDRDYGLLLGIWRPLVFALAISTGILISSVLIVAIHMHMSPLLLARKLSFRFVDVLRNGSISASFEELADECRQKLGIDHGFALAAMPQGTNLFMPISSVGIFVFLIFVANEQQVTVDQIWLLRAAVLSVVLFVATPPVSGANLLAYVAFFMGLGINGTALMDAMIFDVVFGVFANAANLALLQIETIEYARHSGLLDVETLRKP